jgi:hypothetical protein
MASFDFGPASVRAVQNAALAATPEVLETSGGGGVWEMLEAKRVGFNQLGLPRWQLQFPPAEPWADGPMTMIVYEQPVIAYYLALGEGGASETFRSKAKALQDQITRNGLKDDGDGGTGAEFTWLSTRFRIHCYDSDEVNQILLMPNSAVEAGALAFAFLVGDTEH